MFERLLSACHSLEFLLIMCCNITKVRVSGPCSMKRVHLKIIGYTTRLVQIEALNLESFDCKLLSSAGGPVTCVIHTPILKSSKSVHITNTDDWFQELLSKFPFLGDLTLHLLLIIGKDQNLKPLDQVYSDRMLH